MLFKRLGIEIQDRILYASKPLWRSSNRPILCRKAWHAASLFRPPHCPVQLDTLAVGQAFSVQGGPIACVGSWM